VECCLKVTPPAGVEAQIENVVGYQKLEKPEKAQIKLRLGLEMEERDHKDLAMELFKSAGEIDPSNKEIQEKLSSFVATISSGSKYDYLLAKKLVTTDQLQKALTHSKKLRKSVAYILIEKFHIKKDEVGKSLSLYYGCPFKSYSSEVPVPVELMSNLKKSFLLNELWVPLSWEKDGIEILIDDPRDLSKSDHIRTLLKTKKINFLVAIKEDIEAYIRDFFSESRIEASPSIEGMEEEFEMIPDISFEELEDEEQEEELEEASGEVVKLVDQVIVAAYRKNASDIHIEPSPVTKATTIRFRMDGVCHEYLQVPNSMCRGIISRIKIMAGLDIAERRLPQDGKIKFKRKGVPPFELRLATLPTAGAFEDAVLRILARADAMKLDDMGLTDRNLKVMKTIIAQPYGLVLAVGPTGSGKTTSLHAALAEVNKPGIKIWTAEDPVEITQPGLRQLEVRPKIGLDFARVMRSFLRADPDVIMIGEMRDEETASIGIEASLTGHLVLSTLHTNSAPETVTRLLDMGLNPLNFSDAFLGVMAQRLVRRLCTKCREEYQPSREEFDDIVDYYGREHFEAGGEGMIPDVKLFRAVGCELCSGTGYKGRLAIHELMEGTPEIKLMIKKQASTEMLFERAMKEGMNTLKQDGINKAFQGITDIAEVRRVCIK
jgi:type II secretory ATPase GspE/PulE/Tfp pilus assembly ATPase PilB-like protein